jgi:hypothetical protein
MNNQRGHFQEDTSRSPFCGQRGSGFNRRTCTARLPAGHCRPGRRTGGDYALALKDNPGPLHTDVKLFWTIRPRLRNWLRGGCRPRPDLNLPGLLLHETSVGSRKASLAWSGRHRQDHAPARVVAKPRISCSLPSSQWTASAQLYAPTGASGPACAGS